MARFAIANDAAHKLLLNYQLFLLNVITKTHFFFQQPPKQKKKKRKNETHWHNMLHVAVASFIGRQHKKTKKNKAKIMFFTEDVN